MPDAKRIHILHDDAHKVDAWFNVERKSRPDFKILFHRVNEILEHFFERSPDVLEEFTRQWAMEEANSDHEEGQS